MDFNYDIDDLLLEDTFGDGRDQAARLGYTVQDTTFIEQVFKNLINLIRSLIEGLKKFTRDRYTDIKFGAKKVTRKYALREAIAEVENKIAKGHKHLKVFDVWSYCEAVTDAVEMLYKIAYRFERAKYPDLDAMEHDITIMDKMITTEEKVLDGYKKKKKVVSSSEYRAFLLREYNGQSIVFRTIDVAILKLEKMDHLLTKQINVYNTNESTDLLQRRASFIKKITTIESNIVSDLMHVVGRMIITGDAFR